MGSHELRKALRDAAARLGPEGTAELLQDPAVLMTFESAGGEGRPQSVEELISSAAEHGEDSEPDMEDGDLEAHIAAAVDIARRP